QLLILNLTSGKIIHYLGVKDYEFSQHGKILLIQSDDKNGVLEKSQSLTWFDLISGKGLRIWGGTNPTNFVFNDTETELAFVTSRNTQGTSDCSIYYYQRGWEKAKMLVGNNTDGLTSNFAITDSKPLFSKNGDKLLFGIKEVKSVDRSQNTDYTKVTIWSYSDPFLQNHKKENPEMYAVTLIGKNKVIRLNGNAEDIYLNGYIYEDYVLADDIVSDKYWEEDYYHSYLISTTDGSRKLLPGRSNFGFQPSPDDRFVVWFDQDSLNYFSYEVAKRIKRNIGRQVPFTLCEQDTVRDECGIGYPYGYFPGGWGINDPSVYIYDRYDIWKVDLMGEKAPVNITNGYGREHKVVFSIPYINCGKASPYVQIAPRGTLLLTCYDPISKYNGFWKTIKYSERPEKAIMDACSSYIVRTDKMGQVKLPLGFPPVKSKNANTYLIKRSTAASFPNLYITKDFKSLKQISFLHPEKTYNWLTAELMNWRKLDGKMAQGILYKPENFDSSKKYPLIFYYYVIGSDDLNEFITPDWCFGQMNIPYYASNGYLVFVPDIDFRRFHNGEGAVNAVVSAARYISKLPFVDSTKMGLQGHSYGGFETNYIVTHTKNLFSAACTAAGLSDMVDDYYEIFRGPKGNWGQPEIGEIEFGLGATPWVQREMYEENSPIYNISDVTTPLLISHGDKDHAVPYTQGFEMYFSMRRAGKKVWLIEYANSGHGLFDDDAKDFTLRMKQFFDFYLNGAPSPKWMTEGNGNSLDLDISGKKP
ncbi:MAG TPA: prolyl oligopeptidase family serine peptidase, partial [Puia sp.]